MRLQRHLNESFGPKEWEELGAVLEKDCMPYIKQLKGARTLLLRGMKSKGTQTWKKVDQRQDRKPRFVDNSLHEMLDEWTKKHLGLQSKKSEYLCYKQ